eukprot:1401074-Rhodomonas_salina.1
MVQGPGLRILGRGSRVEGLGKGPVEDVAGLNEEGCLQLSPRRDLHHLQQQQARRGGGWGRRRRIGSMMRMEDGGGWRRTRQMKEDEEEKYGKGK